jgi:hypothetical protein
LALWPAAPPWEAKADSKLLTYTLSEPLAGAAAAKFDISTESGNLLIDVLAGGEPVLASSALPIWGPGITCPASDYQRWAAHSHTDIK